MTNQELKALCERVIAEYACNNADGVMLSKGLLRLLAENEAMRGVVEACRTQVRSVKSLTQRMGGQFIVTMTSGDAEMQVALDLTTDLETALSKLESP